MLHNFTGGPDGAGPSSTLVRDKANNVYGVTLTGGDSSCPIGGGIGCGVVFTISSGGQFSVVNTFHGGTDGAFPDGLVIDASGNLYGTADYGGIVNSNCQFPAGYGCGLVYKIDQAGNQRVLYSFQGLNDGYFPFGPLTRDAQGNLYGTNLYGGYLNACAGAGCGVIFEIDTSGNETTLHAFRETDGAFANGAMLQDVKGNLYGTAQAGGRLSCTIGGFTGCGVIFRLASNGAYTVLHVFAGEDGANPATGLTADSHGNGVTTTQYGGTANFGTVIELTAAGKTEVLYSFTDANDGGYPSSGVTIDRSGNIFGNTYQGGDLNCSAPSGCGTVFKIVP